MTPKEYIEDALDINLEKDRYQPSWSVTMKLMKAYSLHQQQLKLQTPESKKPLRCRECGYECESAAVSMSDGADALDICPECHALESMEEVKP